MVTPRCTKIGVKIEEYTCKIKSNHQTKIYFCSFISGRPSPCYIKKKPIYLVHFSVSFINYNARIPVPLLCWKMLKHCHISNEPDITKDKNKATLQFKLIWIKSYLLGGLKWSFLNGAFHLVRTHQGWVGWVKPPIHFHCVLHAKKKGGGGVQKTCKIAYILNGRPRW